VKPLTESYRFHVNIFTFLDKSAYNSITNTVADHNFLHPNFSISINSICVSKTLRGDGFSVFLKDSNWMKSCLYTKILTIKIAEINIFNYSNISTVK